MAEEPQYPVFKFHAKGSTQIRMVLAPDKLYMQTTLGDWELPRDLVNDFRNWLNEHCK